MRVGLEFSDRACVLSKCPTLCDPMDCSPPSPSSPGKNTGMGGHFLVQRIFPAQGSNLPLLSLLLQQADSLPPCHLGSPNSMMSVLKKDLRGRAHTHTPGACRQRRRLAIPPPPRMPSITEAEKRPGPDPP